MIVRDRFSALEPPRSADDYRTEGTSTGSARAWAGPALRAALIVLPIAALTELLLVRTFYRVGIYIPKTGPFRVVYGGLTELGSFALDLSSVLAAVSLGLMAVGAWRSGRANTAFALGAFLVSSVVVRLAGVELLGPMARLAFALAVVALAAPFLLSPAHGLHRSLVAVVATCFLLSSYAGLTADSVRLTGASFGGGTGSQILAELLVVGAALLALAAWGATDRLRLRPVIVAAPLAATLLAAWAANGSITGILALWTVGLRLFLPMWLYALALWAFLATAIGWLPQHRYRSCGLVLLVVSGMLLGSTYVQSIGLIALALLSDGLAVGGLPAPAGRSNH